MTESPKHNYKRLTGLDLARGLAIIGMVFVNFMYVFSHGQLEQLEAAASGVEGQSELGVLAAGVVFVFVAGRAAAVFLVLFGIGLMLQIRRAEYRFSAKVVSPLLKRYCLLIIGGLVFAVGWQGDILHYIGLYGLIALPLTKLSRKWLIALTASVLLCAEVLRLLFDYYNGWQPGAVGLNYLDMWSISGICRQLFFNGYHPVFPWLAYVVYGLTLGRCELTDGIVHVRMIFIGLAVSVTGFILYALGVPAEFFPPHTLFMLLGMANATWVIGLALYLTAHEKFQVISKSVANMGRLALTHYLGHVLLGIIPVVAVVSESAMMSFEKSFLTAVVYIVATLVLGNIWLKYHLQGPLEWVLRKMATTPILRREQQ